jgi:hypothetical protein
VWGLQQLLHGVPWRVLCTGLGVTAIGKDTDGFTISNVAESLHMQPPPLPCLYYTDCTHAGGSPAACVQHYTAYVVRTVEPICPVTSLTHGRELCWLRLPPFFGKTRHPVAGGRVPCQLLWLQMVCDCFW